MRAIDMHVHVPEPPGDAGAEERQRMAGYFKADFLPQSPDDMYERSQAEIRTAAINR